MRDLYALYEALNFFFTSGLAFLQIDSTSRAERNKRSSMKSAALWTGSFACRLVDEISVKTNRSLEDLCMKGVNGYRKDLSKYERSLRPNRPTTQTAVFCASGWSIGLTIQKVPLLATQGFIVTQSYKFSRAMSNFGAIVVCIAQYKAWPNIYVQTVRQL